MTSRSREAAALLVCLGAVFLLPPISLIFARASEAFGVPLPVLYVFGIWLFLVAGALLLALVLPDQDSPE